MTATIRSVLSAIAGSLAFGLVTLTAGAALAGGGNCGCGTSPPTPPTPPSPPHGHPFPGPPNEVNVNVNVNVANAVAVNTNASALSSGSASASGSGSSAAFYGGGGGGGSYIGPSATGFVQNLNVSGGEARRTAFEATRTRMIKVVIEASCIDEKDVPHPASQVTPDRDIDDGYEGEIYRCIAGTHMQYVFAEYGGRIAFDHGQTVTCLNAQALYHSAGGKLECRAQRPARDCNERSLLRRFGAGVKILTMISVEHYTDYREESVQSQTAGTISLDGGVGGMVY